MNFSKDTSSWFEGLQSTLERVIESPKTTVLASTVSATTGVAIASQWITTAIGWLAALVGVVATLFLARVHWLKGNQHELEIKLLEQKLKESQTAKEEVL